MNAVEIEQAVSELAEQPFDPAEFPYAFLEAFGNKATTIKRLRAGASNKSDLGGVLQTSNIHILTCDVGRVTQTLAALKTSPATAKAKAKFILATDGVDFEAEDMASGETVACAFKDFPDHFGFFLPLAGISTVRQISENAFDIRATSRLNRLYVELLKDNPEWGTAERRHDMNNLMARLIFCFFAEDTDIFIGKGRFTQTVAQMSAQDSSNTHEVIATLFRAMNTKPEDRAGPSIPRWAEDFPYVNGRPASEERVIVGFEDIQRFTEHYGRSPQHGEDRDIFERLYAVRLDRLRSHPDYRALLELLDHQSLLAGPPTAADSADKTIDIDELAAELADVAGADEITVLRHVRTSAEKRAAEEVADRKPCEDFETLRPLFERVQAEVKTGMRQSQPIAAGRRAIEAGDFFVLDGLTLYVAEVGEPLKTTAGEVDRRLRLIFSNGTESNLLLRSLQRAFYNDPAARRLASPQSGQVSFGDEFEADDVDSGTIYVLRSLSDHPYVAQHREVIHKVGVTGGKVETRIANAENEATYLLAKVQVVATYKLAGINRIRMEKLFHRLFAVARLNITINDRFGNPVQPEEWFLVPLFVIDEAVARIKDGSITDYIYDPSAAKLVKT